MLRCSRVRKYLQEIASYPRFEQISFIMPILIVIAEIILMNHAIKIGELYVMLLTSFLLTVSIIEVILILLEIHRSQQKTNFKKILTVELDDFIIRNKLKNVKSIVQNFVNLHPEYEKYRNEVYHLACKIMEIHRKERWEEKLTRELKKVIEIEKECSVRELLEIFIKKHPKYKNYKSEVYHRICQIKGVPEEEIDD